MEEEEIINITSSFGQDERFLVKSEDYEIELIIRNTVKDNYTDYTLAKRMLLKFIKDIEDKLIFINKRSIRITTKKED